MFLLALCPGLTVSIYWTLICVHMKGLNAVKTHVHAPTRCFQNSQNKAETKV